MSSSTSTYTSTSYHSLPILLFYLIFAAALSANAALTVYHRYNLAASNPQWRRTHSPHFLWFILLASASLAATWSYMFAFFAHSYRAWLAQASAAHLHPLGLGHDLETASVFWKCELWLRDTKLFRLAWETVSETPERHWWSGQIFLFTVGWSVLLGVLGRRFEIPRVWTFMLLGQIVAISFAQNLFAATVVASTSLRLPDDHDQANRHTRHDGREEITTNINNANTTNKVKNESESKSASASASERKVWIPPSLLELAPVFLSLLGAAAVPLVAHTRFFMPVLLVPHLLLFAPGLLAPRRSGAGHENGYGKWMSATAAARRYTRVFSWVGAVMAGLLAQSTYAVVMAGESGAEAGAAPVWRRVLAAMHEHPAVSSVSWDVVFCFVTGVSWVVVNRGEAQRILGLY